MDYKKKYMKYKIKYNNIKRLFGGGFYKFCIKSHPNPPIESSTYSPTRPERKLITPESPVSENSHIPKPPPGNRATAEGELSEWIKILKDTRVGVNQSLSNNVMNCNSNSDKISSSTITPQSISVQDEQQCGE